MQEPEKSQTDSILGIDWDNGAPHARLFNCSTEAIQKVPLKNYQLSYRTVEPMTRVCIGFRADTGDNGNSSPCLKIPAKGRKCESCNRRESIFASELHHAHRRDRGSLSSRIIDHLQKPNYLYLAVFADGSTKVGTSTARRIETRLLEQGALLASIICETTDGFIVRTLEDLVTEEMGIVQAISTKRKMQGILQPAHQEEINENLGVAHGKVHKFLEHLAFDGSTLIARNWENPENETACWEKIGKYPNSLSAGAHDLTLISIRGRIGAFQRSTEPDFYAADLEEVFGIVIEKGIFPTDDLSIQGQLF